jgi:hypothetical protein
MRKAGAGLRIVYFPGPPPVGDQFPAIGQWVQDSGWIEVGRRQGAGFVARALDDAGPVFENNGSTTLAEALAALEDGLAGLVRDHQAAVRSSSPAVKNTQQRPRSDA